MSKLTPELESEFDALQMELRGYEVARKHQFGWMPVGNYRANEAARKQALQYASDMMHRHPGTIYRVRPIVSIDVDFARRVEIPGMEDAVLNLDSDQEQLQLELPLPEPPPSEEKSLIIKPEGNEFGGTGYHNPDGPEIPYNYDEISKLVDVPDPWGKK